jgi:hypothetical protein
VIARHACALRTSPSYFAEWYKVYRRNRPCGLKVTLGINPEAGSYCWDIVERRRVYSTEESVQERSH